MTRLYELSGHLWRFDGQSLVKAGKKASPGQMSLFDESSHKRDQKGRFTSSGEAIDHHVSEYQKKTDGVKQQVSRMSEDELESADSDRLLEDHWIQTMTDLEDDSGIDADTLADDHGLDDHYGHSVKQVEDALGKRSQQFDQMVDDASSLFSEKLAALPEPASHQEWQQQKAQAQSMHQMHLTEHSSKLSQEGAGKHRHTELASEMKDTLDAHLDLYSDDPEDWDE